MRVDHGLNLRTPVLQPRPQFSVTAAGFDTGQRTFKVGSAYFEDVIPERHTPDTRLEWTDGRAIIRGRYARMFVNDVDIVEETNGITTYNVRLLGMIGKTKPGDFDHDTEVGQYRAPVSQESQSALIRVTAYESVPTVTHVYLSDKVPDRNEVGTKMTPPITNDSGGRRLRSYLTGLTSSSEIILFEGWVLRSRSYRNSGSIWEVRDRYAYEKVRYTQ